MASSKNVLEETMQDINRQVIQLQEEKVKANNECLKKILEQFLVEFQKDPFFCALYERFFYGGSFYDGLKISEPDEFDIDFVFKLPISAKSKVLCDKNVPGYVKVQLMEIDSLRKNNYHPLHKDMIKLIDEEKYLSIPKVVRWFQSLVDKAKDKIPLAKSIVKVQSGSGPAVTLKITDYSNQSFDVDFVPCFKFTKNDWPENFRTYHAYIENNQLAQEFLVVPKPKDSNSNTYFRLSFQGQERDIINNRGHLKPAIRLLKCLRDQYNDTIIKSYYIKTIALWALNDNTLRYKSEPLSSIFLQLLRRYISALEKGEIKYYWNPNLNLLDANKSIFYNDTCNRLKSHLSKLQEENVDKILEIFKVKRVEADDNNSQVLAIEEPEGMGFWQTAGIAAAGIGLISLFASLRTQRRDQ